MYWKIAIFLMMLIWMFWHKVEVNKKVKDSEKEEEAFWERESKANSVRKKPIDALDYIKIPKDLPVYLCPDNIEIPDILNTIERLRKEKILNLTGYTNTDLKMEYGTANISELSLYDENYTTLITTLQKWVDVLLEEDYEEEAVKLMEFMVSTGSDIGKTYRLLGKYYLKHGREEDYEKLIEACDLTRSLNKPYIIESLKELKNQL